MTAICHEFEQEKETDVATVKQARMERVMQRMQEVWAWLPCWAFSWGGGGGGGVVDIIECGHVVCKSHPQ